MVNRRSAGRGRACLAALKNPNVNLNLKLSLDAGLVGINKYGINGNHPMNRPGRGNKQEILACQAIGASAIEKNSDGLSPTWSRNV